MSNSFHDGPHFASVDDLFDMLDYAARRGKPKLMAFLVSRRERVPCPVKLGGSHLWSCQAAEATADAPAMPGFVIHYVADEPNVGPALAIAVMHDPSRISTYFLPFSEIAHILGHDHEDEGQEMRDGNPITVCPDLPRG